MSETELARIEAYCNAANSPGDLQLRQRYVTDKEYELMVNAMNDLPLCVKEIRQLRARDTIGFCGQQF